MLNNFELGEMVMVIGDSEGDDPIAAELANKHGVIHDIYYGYATLTFLNGERYKVALKNLKKL